METEVKKINIIVFDKFEATLNEWKKKYEVVPDATDTEGFNALKENLKEYRTVKKQVEEMRMAERRKLTEIGEAINLKSGEIMKVVEEVFGPHKEAKEAEDKRKKEVAEKKKREKEIRLDNIRGYIEEIREHYVNAIDFTASELKTQIEIFKMIPITFEIFEDHIDEAEEVYETTLKKLNDLHATRLMQETDKEELEKQQKELKEAQEKQRLEDEERAKAQKAKDEADRQAVEEDKKKLAEEKAAFQQEVEYMRAEKKKMEDQEAKLRDEAVDREAQKIEDERLKKEAEDKRLREAEEEKQRLEAERVAKIEAKERRSELAKSIMDIFSLSSNETYLLIRKVEDGEIPFTRIDWTKK